MYRIFREAVNPKLDKATNDHRRIHIVPKIYSHIVHIFQIFILYTLPWTECLAFVVAGIPFISYYPYMTLTDVSVFFSINPKPGRYTTYHH
jgi:Na+/H+ antiporter NhaC